MIIYGHQQAVRGIGALSDDQLVSLAVATLFSAVPLHGNLQRLISREFWERDLTDVTARRACDAANGSAERLLQDEDHLHPGADHWNVPTPWPVYDTAPPEERSAELLR